MHILTIKEQRLREIPEIHYEVFQVHNTLLKMHNGILTKAQHFIFWFNKEKCLY